MFYKRTFPIILIGIVCSFEMNLFWHHSQKDLLIGCLPLIMIIFGYLIMKSMILDLVDEVWNSDDGILTIKKGKLTDTIKLENITNIESSFTNPTRVTINLMSPSLFGNKIVFSPIVCWNPFKLNKNIIDIINRVEKINNDKKIFEIKERLKKEIEENARKN
jgi:hypothetical protein